MLNRARNRRVAKKQPPLIRSSLFAGADVCSSQFLMVRRKCSQILSYRSTDGRHLKSRPTRSVSDLKEMITAVIILLLSGLFWSSSNMCPAYSRGQVSGSSAEVYVCPALR
ncbi:hypothetical protein Q8A67_023985 [Cirrhinus molitorella]|uniref:Uncharacterized protein n=1 Tax=Cirrhinus molitorella TaxID=172907 RepID=A0AA88P8K8_9TELE|nr:hypothetical protein Q8A67_023985 [Cirrhinus molitorella]